MADAAPFGTLLREHRVSRSLTQERLAERAGVSTTAIAALEAGRRRAPRLSTVALLVDALGLDGAQRVALAAAAVSGRLPDGAGTETASAARRPASPTEYPGVIRQIDFVGRPEERAALDAAWQRRTRVVLVSGEAGAGKTRLVGELALVVAAEHPVLWGRCTPERLGVYEPFVDPVRVAMREPRLEPATNPILRELERMLPELAAGRSGTPGPSIAAPDVERRLLFDAVAALLAATGRALLVVDDLHWADAGSLALLSHLAASPALGDLTIVGKIGRAHV